MRDRRAGAWLILLALLGISSLASVPVMAQTFPISQSVRDTDPGDTVLTGNPFTYRINYRCNSQTTSCQSVSLVWTMPPELVFVSALGTTDVAMTSTPGAGNNGPVTFTFNDPVPAGNTGDLDILVRFPNGSTPNNTVTTGTTDNATATGGNIPPSTASAPDVTGLASNNTSISKIVVGGQSFLDDFPQATTYRITVDPSSGGMPGSLDLTGVTVTDALPMGAICLSATLGGACDSPAVGQVTWDNGGAGFSVPVGSPLQVEVTVSFPGPGMGGPFTDGQTVTNTFEATVTPLGEPTAGVGPQSIDHTVDAFVEMPSGDVDKRFGGGFVAAAIGQTFLYDVIIRNNGNIDLDGVTVTDTVPVEVDVVSVNTGAYGSGYGGTVSVSFTTNLGGPTALGSSPGGTNATFAIPALGAGEFVTEVEWSFSGPIPPGTAPINGSNRARVQATVIDPDNNGMPVNVGDTITNCVDLDWTASPMQMGVPASGSDNDCFDLTVSGPFTLSSPRKVESTGGPYLPGATVSFRLDVDNQSQASTDLPEPIVVDLLPDFLEYQTGSFTYDDQTTGVPAPTFEELPNYNNTGRTLLRWSFPPGSALMPGQEVRISYDTTLLTGAIAGTISNVFGQTHNDPGVIQRCNGSSTADAADLDDDADTGDILCTASEGITVASVAQLSSGKLVKGQCDLDFSLFPDTGVTVRGGAIDYRFEVTNTGTVPTTNFVIVDILPFVGDTGVLDLTPRDTAWKPILTGPISPPPGASIFYSTSGNPCRPEVGGPTTGCDPPNWSTVPPVPITAVQSFKIEFGDRVLNPLDTLTFELNMIAPADAPIAADPMNPVSGEIAWNSFAFGTDRVDGGSLNAEPLKVGIAVKDDSPASLGDFVWLDNDGNGLQDPGEPGLNNVPVELFDPGPDGIARTGDDVSLFTSITADDAMGNPGWYNFTNLPAGDYYVQFTPPPNFDVTVQDAGDEALDSDTDPLTACTDIVTLGAMDVNPDVDMGLLPPTTASLGNYVWFDRNGDGVQNEATTDGANGVAVYLFTDADGDGVAEPNADDGPPVGLTATADDGAGNPGFYRFEDLVPGKYFVMFMLPPSASGFTVQDAGGDDQVDSDADTGTGNSQIVMLMAGDADFSLDGGLIPLAGNLSLGNQVWCDDNGDMVVDPTDDDGVFDPTIEDGVDGVRLNLYNDLSGDGLPQPDEFFAATITATVAGNMGRYRFDDLVAGDYIVEVDASNFLPGGPLEGKSTSTGNSPAPDPDDDADGDDNGDHVGVPVLSPPITLSAGGEPDTDGGDDAERNDDDINFTLDFGFRVGAAPAFDYGDAPDAASGTAPGDYRTVALDGGAFHEQVAGEPFLGACVDADDGMRQDVLAIADDLGGAFAGTFGTCGANRDDEDGVTFLDAFPFTPGSTLTGIQVDASSDGGTTPCTLNAWIDWDQDGVFGSDPGEQIATDLVIPSGTSATLTPLVPPTAVPGRTYARFRCSTMTGLGPDGPAPDGEVEDYLVRVKGTDFGDAPDSYDTLSASGGPSHMFDPGVTPVLGACVDHEIDAQTPLDGSGDDLSFGPGGVGACGDDEDGVSFDTMVVACQPATLTVTASTPARLDAWIDFGGDGGFDPGDQIATDQALASGPNSIAINVPCDAVAGNTYARFRLSTAGGLGAGGPAMDGEVEDHPVLVKGNDFGDAPDSYTTTLGAGGPFHGVDPFGNLFLGTCVDTEPDAVAPLDATGDDLGIGASSAGVCIANDDEDGVAFTTMVVACGNATVQVTAGAAGLLDAWIDFDGNGSFAGAGEQIFASQALAAGVNNLTVAVPCNALPGNTFSRFRVSTAGGLAIGGGSIDGEVEDHALLVKGVDFGDADDSYGTLFGSGGPNHAVDPTLPLHLGACVDTEIDGAPTVSATGDDVAAGTSTVGTCAVADDDEDGVSFDTMLVACEQATLTVTASAAALLDAWIDFDASGTFTAADQIFASQAVAAGANVLTVNVPCSALPGTTSARFRVSSAGGTGPGGAAADGEVEDYTVILKGTDLGDAPDTYGTLFGSNGARHAVDPALGFFLGACVDTEADGQPAGGNATGDDLGIGSSAVGACAANDDEDGVVFDTLITACKQAQVTVTASAAGLLDAWIDFDADGTFVAATDQVFASQPVAAGANTLTFAVPCSAAQATTFARFRLSSAGGLTPTGAAADGEIEDYQIGSDAADLGDAPDTYGTLFASGGPLHGLDPALGLYLGACVDSETDGQPSPNADGDDLGAGASSLGACAGNDDEDGVSFDTMLIACQQADFTVTASSSGFLDAWVDLDGDGTFAGPNDQVFASQPLAAGANALSVVLPCDILPGSSHARFRVSAAGGLAPGGTVSNGEVEDYAVQVKGADLGDAPDGYQTTIGTGGPSHGVDAGLGLFLGACVDTDADGQPHADATGDDLGAGSQTLGACAVPNDDEDGVSFDTMVNVCLDATVTVTASTAGFVDAWIDLDGDGTFNGPADAVIVSQPLVAGPNSFTFNVPCDAVPGDSYARFRLSSSGGLGFAGPSMDGEVEDYALLVKGFDFGDSPDPAYPTLLVSDGARHIVLTTGNPTLGQLADIEPVAQESADHLGDDSDGMDDEDGVSFQEVELIPGTTTQIDLTTGTVGGNVSAWIDWNLDGDWTDPGEQVATDLALGPNAAMTLDVPVPVGAVAGPSCARFRISSATGLVSTGQAMDGEVEDYAVEIGVEDPVIGAAKDVLDIADLPGGVFQVTYEVLIENFGNVPLSEISAIVDLSVAFPDIMFTVLSLSSDDFMVNPNYDGENDTELLSPGVTLAVGAMGSVELVVEIEPRTNGGPFFCSAEVRGTSPADVEVVDMSHNGSDPDPDGNGPDDDDDPTPVELDIDVTEIPTLGGWGMLLLIGILIGVAIRRINV